MRLLRSILLIIVAFALLLVAVGAYVFNSWTRGPLPQHDGTLTVAGLNAPVTIIRDERGVPHIYASNQYDLFFAQGFTHAQDRWWQMEFFRHTGRGSLQELTGKTNSLMGTDIFIRTAGWLAAAERDIPNYSDDTLAILQAFADGVNAYITSRPAGQLAFEYNVLGVTGVNIPIEPWTPLDTIVWGKVMAWDLSGNQSEERVLSTLLEALPQEMVDAYMPGYPYGELTTVIQPEDLPASGTSFEENIAYTPGDKGIVGLRTRLAGNFDDSQGLAFARGTDIGSNNWVVHGSRTQTGLPLLANDPHLGIQMPSIWYEVGLYCQPVSDECPFSVRGFAFAPSPAVIIGHNAHIAWGVTNTTWDTQDLYRIEVNPDNDLQYRWDGEWRDMTTRTEEIRFGDGEPSITFTVRETHLGPIINDNQRDDDGNIMGFNNENPLALRWTAHDPGTLFEAVLGLNRATNFAEFRDALRWWDTPSQNVIYADTQGNIGYQTPGRIPVRAPGHDGLLPVDGTDSANEWLGFVPFEHLPTVFNPERGYIATANQALVPFEYYAQLAEVLADEFGADAHYVFGYQWDYGYRGQRIVDLLEAIDTHSFETFRTIHGDNYFYVAPTLVSVLNDIDFEDDALTTASQWLAEWDGQMDANSAQAALFGAFWLELAPLVYQDQLEDADSVGLGSQVMYAITQMLDAPDNRWWDDATTDETETRDDMLKAALQAAYASLSESQGTNREQWRWGSIHTATFVSNPLGLSGISLIEDIVNRGPLPVGGGSAIVNATGWRSDGTVRALPSMRMIIDLSDLDNNQAMHTTGQSGHPYSERYFDMGQDWASVNYGAMHFERESVERNASATLTLQPAR